MLTPFEDADSVGRFFGMIGGMDCVEDGSVEGGV